MSLIQKVGRDPTYQKNTLDRWYISSPFSRIQDILEKILQAQESILKGIDLSLKRQTSCLTLVKFLILQILQII